MDSTRPFVTMNVASSIDGKLAPVGPEHVSFGSAEDRAHMEELRAEADAVLIGGNTLRTEDPPLIIRDPSVRARRLAAKGKEQPLNITVMSALPAHLPEMNFFRDPLTEKLVFTTAKTPPALLETAARFARVEVVATDEHGRVDLAALMRRLPALGVHRLLLEGGGELNFSMLDAGLLDQIHLTLCPFVFGGRDAPSSFGGDGFERDMIRRLSLKSHRVGSTGEVFLVYDVIDEPVDSQKRENAKGYQIS